MIRRVKVLLSERKQTPFNYAILLGGTNDFNLRDANRIANNLKIIHNEFKSYGIQSIGVTIPELQQVILIITIFYLPHQENQFAWLRELRVDVNKQLA
jgi:hypothetical protein